MANISYIHLFYKLYGSRTARTVRLELSRGSYARVYRLNTILVRRFCDLCGRYSIRTRQRQSAQPESFNTLRQTSCESLKKTFVFPFLSLCVCVCSFSIFTFCSFIFTYAKYRHLETSLYITTPRRRSIGVTMLLDAWSYEGSTRTRIHKL